ncbi:MAG: CDP-alcohol phosphatidyltransferase family protein [Patescibacteria group bacterium]|nr:CDP-alcohol phosphatidyltransferase family protein [Patescibacteria group bacterium]
MNEKELTEKSQLIRSKIATPIAKLLAKTPITPNMLSATGVILMIFFPILIKSYPWVSFGLMIATLAIDGLMDGALARYKGVSSDRGKFFDITADTISFILLMVGILRIWLINPIYALLFTSLFVIHRVFAVIVKNVRKETNWFISPRPGILTGAFMNTFQIAFALWIIWGFNWFDEIALVSIAILIPSILLHFKAITSMKL